MYCLYVMESCVSEGLEVPTLGVFTLCIKAIRAFL